MKLTCAGPLHGEACLWIMSIDEHEFVGHEEDLGELFPDGEVVLPCPGLVGGAKLEGRREESLSTSAFVRRMATGVLHE